MTQVCQDCPVDVLLTGLIAGIALAIPLGPMALLLISTTLQHGRKISTFGALAMSSVDFIYALLTATFGVAVVAALSAWVWPLRILGSVLLVIISIQFFLGARKDFAGLSDTPQMTSRTKTYARFFALTVINPATAFYFVGIVPSVAASTAGQSTVITALIFAIGVFIASIFWQLTLVFAATVTKSFTNPKIQSLLRMVGAGLIAVLAVGLLLR